MTMILRSAKKILIGVDLVGATDLSRRKNKTLIHIDLVSATVLAGANDSGERKKDLDRH